LPDDFKVLLIYATYELPAKGLFDSQEQIHARGLFDAVVDVIGDLLQLVQGLLYVLVVGVRLPRVFQQFLNDTCQMVVRADFHILKVKAVSCQ
jgi:hypothetical protein